MARNKVLFLRPSSVLVALGLMVLSACAVSSTPSASSTIDEVTNSLVEVESTLPESAPLAVETTVPETTVPETTTTLPALDIMCITTLKCQFANLVGVDYSLLKLEFTDFSVANLAGAHFVRANLKQTQFIRANITGTDFTGANLASANFTGAVIAGANFTNANMLSTVICGWDLETVVGISAKQLSEVQTFRTKGNLYCP
jgi:uncharacterized protein YjbI with pentapeptide repeats